MKFMTWEDFQSKIAVILEVDSVEKTTEFKGLKEWCSLQAFGILVMLENDFHKRINIDGLMALSTVGEIYELAIG